MVRKDTGGGKKLKAKGGAASAPSAVPASTGDVLNNWEDQWQAGDIVGQDGSRKTQCGNYNITKIRVLKVGLGTGEDLDNPNWLDKTSDKDFAALHKNLLPKKKCEVLSQQQLFRDLLSEYNIDSISAQGWEDNGIHLQDIIKWRSLGLTLEQSKLWYKNQFKVDVAT
ncbi:hypothetical protein DSO57_1033193 [Entomophthora muscae]|uniref:Uncharacterized protein n=1 Tax=Entomophthora muscae TaxID=34485 RepID=A0ACC2RR14_9FUNG|nr:hypothetical protein DSO57_1033193 [Entomophthora muscae]